MKNLKNITLIILLLISGGSCKQDTFFQLSRPVQPPWTSVTEFENAVREPYVLMMGSAWGSPVGTLSLKNYAESDISQLLQGITGANYSINYYNRLYKTLLPEDEISWCFPYLYDVITACNAPLQLLADAAAANKDPFPAMTTSDKELLSRYKGELLFMRGLAYWYLARMYAPPYDPAGTNDKGYFVLRREYTNSATALKNPKLGTVAEVWKAIQEDLEQAKSLLPESYVTTEPAPKGRVNKFAASAMLSRVYFITGQFAKAKTECDYVIGGPYKLDNDPFTPFNLNAGANSDEVIWEIAFFSGSARYDRVPTIFSKCNYNARNGGRGAGGASYSRCTWANLTLAYSTLKQIGWMADGQNGNYTTLPGALKDKRFTTNYCRLGEYRDIPAGISADSVLKFQNTYETAISVITTPQVWEDKHFRAADGRRSNVPMLRLSEFLLTRSIILFNQNDKAGAAADLNVVRERAGLDDILAANITAQDIHNERIRELAAENGDRTYYLIGLRQPIGIGDRDAGKFTPILPPYSDYYWQVPLEEQQLNKAYTK